MTEPQTSASSESAPPRVAVFLDMGQPPRVSVVPWAPPRDLARDLAVVVDRAVASQRGRIPPLVVRELIDNLVHADFADAVITVFDGGDALRISDHGPGIPDKDQALRAGFTSADSAAIRTIRGVGSGFALVREALATLEGTLEIEDNLGRGTVVTARIPPLPAQEPLAVDRSRPQLDLTDRQLRTLLLIVELGPVGPTRLAEELGISASTAYRDLVDLGRAGFVEADHQGRRLATERGLEHLQTVL